MDGSVFDGIIAAIEKDRLAYLSDFFSAFYNLDVFLGDRISEEVVRDSWNVAAGASAAGTLACPPTWLADFRADLPRIDVPTLIIQGDSDRILPFPMTGKRLPDLIEDQPAGGNGGRTARPALDTRGGREPRAGRVSEAGIPGRGVIRGRARPAAQARRDGAALTPRRRRMALNRGQAPVLVAPLGQVAHVVIIIVRGSTCVDLRGVGAFEPARSGLDAS